ncbi:MAG: hydroxymethylbilane synthase [Desulfohalobiaceae bacterium]|nr:hydroxymethylbilane synthase [Desulfohalobiaceae bacterium]
MPEKVIIATRGSKLALWQAEYVADQLKQQYQDLLVELKIVKTTGDTILDIPLAKVGGKGLFVKEIEEAILSGEADLAVHSLKDVPGEIVPELTLGVLPERGNPGDSLVSYECPDLASLPQGAVVGTSSLRRQAQLLSLRPDLRIKTLRGNLDTRLRKLQQGEYQAVVLASAGLERLGIGATYHYRLSPPDFLPAVGQGALGIEFRRDNRELASMLEVLDHEPTRIAVTAERAFLQEVEGGCQVPMGGYAEIKNGRIALSGFVSDPDGRNIIRRCKEAAPFTADALGREVGREILEAGGREILAEISRLEQEREQ